MTSRRRTSRRMRANARRLPPGMTSWAGIDALEATEGKINNRLVSVILGDVAKGRVTRSQAEVYIRGAEGFIADLESQYPPGGARGRAGRWKAHHLDKLRGYVARAKKQLDMTPNRRSSRRLRANNAFTGENYDIVGEKVQERVRALQDLSGMAAADAERYQQESLEVSYAWRHGDYAYLRDSRVISAKDYEGLMSWDGAS